MSCTKHNYKHNQEVLRRGSSGTKVTFRCVLIYFPGFFQPKIKIQPSPKPRRERDFYLQTFRRLWNIQLKACCCCSPVDAAAGKHSRLKRGGEWTCVRLRVCVFEVHVCELEQQEGPASQSSPFEASFNYCPHSEPNERRRRRRGPTPPPTWPSAAGQDKSGRCRRKLSFVKRGTVLIIAFLHFAPLRLR